jgi:TrmH family RNA methyltransferase
MLSKSKGKFIRSLQLRKYRQKYHKIVVEGIKILNELLDEYPDIVITICAQEECSEKFERYTSESREVIIVSEREMKQISSLKNPPPVLAVIEHRDSPASPQDAVSGLCLYLDAIRDPGNLGTIFRIADWFGIQTIFMSPDTADPFNPKVIQSSMASVFRVKWAYMDLGDVLKEANVPVLASVIDGKSMSEVGAMQNGLLVLGNESRGISSEILEQVTDTISIPGDDKLGAESLNVAVAAGILCAHLRGIQPTK